MKDPVAGLLLVLSIVAIIGGISALVIWLQKKRTQALQSIAQTLKLQFFPKGDDRIAPLLANLDIGLRLLSLLERNLVDRALR